jgi:hypothetical protein
LEGETPPNSNILFPVAFENVISTPFEEVRVRDCRLRKSLDLGASLEVAERFDWKFEIKRRARNRNSVPFESVAQNMETTLHLHRQKVQFSFNLNPSEIFL